MPLIDLPDVRQRADHDCGAAVFACVTRYWEGRGRKIKSHPIHGTPPDQLEPAFRAAGYLVSSGNMTVGDLKHHAGQGRPVVCPVQWDGCGHWVVVRGVARGRVYLMDPANGPTSVTLAEWEACWHDADRRATVYERHGLAVWC
jgi:ABC-type bacteriocin/lantibiotic exporter with double-glycine peptidase domain